MVPRALACAAGFAGLVAAVTLACGPSYQALYEGDARFEHCYALEETGNASMQQRSECWRDWMLRYTYGQTRDRVEYAAARYRALSRAPEAPTDEAMMQAAPGEGRGTSIAAPAPTSAFAPPPKTLSEMDGSAPVEGELPGYLDASAAPLPVPTESKGPPGANGDCAAACAKTRATCDAKCVGKKKCDACARNYAKCAHACAPGSEP
jgi:hypothetical protein